MGLFNRKPKTVEQLQKELALAEERRTKAHDRLAKGEAARFPKWSEENLTQARDAARAADEVCKNLRERINQRAGGEM